MAKCGRPTIYHTEAERKSRNKEGRMRFCGCEFFQAHLLAQSAFRKRRDDRIRQLEEQVSLLAYEKEQLQCRLVILESQNPSSSSEAHIGKIPELVMRLCIL